MSCCEKNGAGNLFGRISCAALKKKIAAVTVCAFATSVCAFAAETPNAEKDSTQTGITIVTRQDQPKQPKKKSRTADKDEATAAKEPVASATPADNDETTGEEPIVEKILPPAKTGERTRNIIIDKNETPTEETAQNSAKEREQTSGERRHNKEGITRVKFAREMDKVRLMWDIVPNAVMYQLVLLKNEKDTADNIVHAVDYIYTNGIELDLRLYGDERKNFFYKVCPLNYEGVPIKPFSKPRPITDGEFNTVAPLPQSEFDKMAFAPLYPTYAWLPFLDAVQYQIRVFRHRADGDTLINNIIATDHDAYEWSGYTHPDEYYWQIRALDPTGRAISEWSEKKFFTVTTPTTVAAFGDSITHGGGATSIPPCRTLYDWETYCPVPVKNLGKSGDTTQDMLKRFESDVLPFKPKILVVMGGVNDYRQGISSDVTIENLIAIRERCFDHGIFPVFVTPTPINAWLMNRRKLASAPYHQWHALYRDVVHWVHLQRYFVDITAPLSDADGDLNGTLSSDGLHPDYEGKKYIGEAIGKYLRENFETILEGNQ